MPLFDANSLALYRNLQQDNMSSECDLIAFANLRTATGSTQRTPFIVETVACRLAVARPPSIVVEADQQTPRAEYVVYLPDGTDTTDVERLTVRGIENGSPWSVELLVSGQSKPRTFAASVQLRATLAEDSIVPPPLVAIVTIEEA